MVNKILLILVGLLCGAGQANKLPADSTTEWCSLTFYRGSNLDPDPFACYPNPLGQDYWRYWIRIPDVSKVEGCLAEGSANFPGGYTWSYDSTVWYDWILSGWGGPRVPRLELGAWDNTACTYRIDLKPGDSLLLEYKLTPADTAVADTIRGSMMVEWIGYTWSTAVDPSRPRTAARPWREENAVHLPLNFSGEWAVHDPSGRRIPTRSEGKADGIRLVLPRGARDRLLLLTGPAGSFVLPPPRR